MPAKDTNYATVWKTATETVTKCKKPAKTVTETVYKPTTVCYKDGKKHH
jgi:hypothetical protein